MWIEIGETAQAEISNPFLYTEKAMVYGAVVLNCSALWDSKEKVKNGYCVLKRRLCLR